MRDAHFNPATTNKRYFLSVAQPIRDQFLGVKYRGGLRERRFGIVGHDFKRAVTIAERLEPSRIRREEALRAERTPLKDVDELVKVQRFIARAVALDELGIEIGDAAIIRALKFGKLIQAKRCQRRHRHAFHNDDPCRAEQFPAEIMRQPRKPLGRDRLRLARVSALDRRDPRHETGKDRLKLFWCHGRGVTA